MSGGFYLYLVGLSRFMGVWIIGFFAWWVASFYFLFKPSRVGRSMDLYKTLFPHKGKLSRLWLTWRQFHAFAGLFAERVRLDRGGMINRKDEGLDVLLRAAKQGTGGVLLMSHVGTWEIAARLFKAEGISLMLFMGEKEKEQVERLQKKDLLNNGVEVLSYSADRRDEFSAVEGLRFVRKGGLVSFAGDRLWPGQKSVEVNFLGRRVMLPAGPHLFALAAKVPIFIFFAFRTGRKNYHMVMYGPKKIEASSRSERWSAIEKSAQEYADLLQEQVRRFPIHFFHFEPFLGEPVKPRPGKVEDASS